MGITLEEAKALKYGQVIYHKKLKNSDGTPVRLRVSGEVKTLKRTPSYIKIPLKHGLYDHAYLINNQCPKYVDGKWLIPTNDVELNEEEAMKTNAIHEHEFIIVGPHCWGRGKNPPEAWKNCKKNWSNTYAGGPPMKAKANCYQVPVGSTVSEVDGSIHFPAGTKRCVECKQMNQNQWKTR